MQYVLINIITFEVGDSNNENHSRIKQGMF